tara:strand:- start:3057 stop:3266 length:210 start_codon:yes stop_codon:yes gene_type:complete
MTKGTLVENDYYIEEGRYVFTASYHIQRGRCCGNGCRHCPYSPKHKKHTLTLDKSYVKKQTVSVEDSKK